MTISDPFERHGLTHLSPSSLRLYNEAPAVWTGRYILKIPDEAGPGAWRGTAVEAGLDQILFGQGTEIAHRAMWLAWNERALGLIDPAAEREQEALNAFLMQAAIAFSNEQTKPLQRQAKISLTIPGISVPLIGYADYLWTDHGTDLKTTWRMPALPDSSHVEQVACYSMYHGVGFDLTYVTPKKWARYEVTKAMAEEAYDRVIEGCHAIKSFLAHVSDGYDALSMLAPDYNHYMFSPPMVEAIRAAKARRTIPGEPSHTKLETVK